MTPEMAEFLKAFGTTGLGAIVERLIQGGMHTNNREVLVNELRRGFGMLQNALESQKEN